jgi:hypothetical protein
MSEKAFFLVILWQNYLKKKLNSVQPFVKDLHLSNDDTKHIDHDEQTFKGTTKMGDGSGVGACLILVPFTV